MPTLSPSGLQTVGAYGATNWWNTYNTNINLLNSTLLKLQGLTDVNKTGLENGKILAYSASAGKFVPVTPALFRKGSRP